MAQSSQLRDAALQIFRAALRGVDAQAAVRRAVSLDGARLNINDTNIDLATRRGGIYSIAIGKAAHAMAASLDEILGEWLTAGVLAGLPLEYSRGESASVLPVESASVLSARWRIYAGGHPLPNEESLAAARAAFELLCRAEAEQALILFLISGGGSALIEWPKDEATTLTELQVTNRLLVNCGASIAEINAVRRAVSAVKGGGLAAQAPHADQVTLIISDTNTGEESNVASGPTFAAPPDAPDAAAVIARYGLAARLPDSILRAIAEPKAVKTFSPRGALRQHFVLLTNEDAIAYAANEARAFGLSVEVAADIVEQKIDDGCAQLFERLLAAHQHSTDSNQAICLLSGGEFACPVRGRGIGGRNSETALRLALKIGEWTASERRADSLPHIVALSAGTDGIDGNSVAAGALCDETTLQRAREMNLDAQRFLETSDAHTFFESLGDSIITGPTGTNVRDLRIMLIG